MVNNNISKKHIINQNWCKGCAICVEFCPKQVLSINAREKSFASNPEKCIACKLCELRCPDLAIEIITEKNSDN